MFILLDEIDHSCIFQALDGFVIVLTRDFEVFYASETVQEYLGLAQVMGNSYLKQKQSVEIIFKLTYLYNKGFPYLECTMFFPRT